MRVYQTHAKESVRSLLRPRLVAQLLQMSRLDSPANLEETEVAEAVAETRETLAALAPQAMARQQTLDLRGPDTLHLPMAAGLVAVLVGNLVDNALRYSPQGACIDVIWQRDINGINVPTCQKRIVVAKCVRNSIRSGHRLSLLNIPACKRSQRVMFGCRKGWQHPFLKHAGTPKHAPADWFDHLTCRETSSRHSQWTDCDS